MNRLLAVLLQEELITRLMDEVRTIDLTCLNVVNRWFQLAKWKSFSIENRIKSHISDRSHQVQIGPIPSDVDPVLVAFQRFSCWLVNVSVIYKRHPYHPRWLCLFSSLDLIQIGCSSQFLRCGQPINPNKTPINRSCLTLGHLPSIYQPYSSFSGTLGSSFALYSPPLCTVEILRIKPVNFSYLNFPKKPLLC